MKEELRHNIRAQAHADEERVVNRLLQEDSLDSAAKTAISDQATLLVEGCRQRSHEAGTLDAFLQEFGLSNKEGVALMCLAEALLRVPDEATADQIIAEKIRSGGTVPPCRDLFPMNGAGIVHIYHAGMLQSSHCHTCPCTQ